MNFIKSFFPACNCDPSGSLSELCNTDPNNSIGMGQCTCKKNVEGKNCNQCKDGFYNLRIDNPEGCNSE